MEERVQKLIAAAGVCSRRAAEDLIEEGRVTVNGKMVTLGNKADSTKDIIKVDGQKVHFTDKKLYIALNKPKFIETTLNPTVNHKTIIEFMPPKAHLYPIGRLDYDSEGLLLCTNDGEFANRIMHPRYEIEKTYFVRLDGPLTEEQEAEISGGIKLKDGYVRRIRIRKLTEDRMEWEITVIEGRNKIVKRIFKATGHYVRVLKRYRIGPITLEGIKPGRFRQLTPDEIKKLIELSEGARKQPKRNVESVARPRIERSTGFKSQFPRAPSSPMRNEKSFTGVRTKTFAHRERVHSEMHRTKREEVHSDEEQEGSTEETGEEDAGADRPRRPFERRGPPGERSGFRNKEKMYGRASRFDQKPAEESASDRRYGEKRGFNRDRTEKRDFSSERRYDRKPYGDRSTERKSYGDRSRSFERKPFGEKRDFNRRPSSEGGDERPKSFGRKPFGDRSSERKSFGDRFGSFERKPFGEKREFNRRPSSEGGDERPKSFGRKPFGDRSSERKFFGDRSGPFERKPFGERRPFNSRRDAPSKDGASEGPKRYGDRSFERRSDSPRPFQKPRYEGRPQRDRLAESRPESRSERPSTPAAPLANGRPARTEKFGQPRKKRRSPQRR